MARPVAKFTVAETSLIALSFFCTRAAHDAQVIPRSENSSCRGADDAGSVTAPDDTAQCLPSSKNPAGHPAGCH